MTRPGLEPAPPASEANALTIREQDNSPTRQLTDTVFETIHRQILRQLTDTSEDNSPTLLFKVNDL